MTPCEQTRGAPGGAHGPAAARDSATAELLRTSRRATTAGSSPAASTAPASRTRSSRRRRCATEDFAELARRRRRATTCAAAEIGRGGMGRIVRARDRRLGRAVAIKELLDERLRARFEREARITARLQHPAIVHVHEAGRWPSGEPFYAMKFVAGQPLDEVIGGAEDARRAAGAPAERDRRRRGDRVRAQPSASSTAISSRRTSSSARSARRSSSTGASRRTCRRRGTTTAHRRPTATTDRRSPAAGAGARRRTCRPSRRAAATSTSARTSTRSARCSTTCSRVARPTEAGASDDVPRELARNRRQGDGATTRQGRYRDRGRAGGRAAAVPARGSSSPPIATRSASWPGAGSAATARSSRWRPCSSSSPARSAA